jgi:hypothetical protein
MPDNNAPQPTTPDRFAKFPTWLRDRSDLGTARLLYVILGTYANAGGECWPGMKSLSDNMGASKRTIIRMLNTLEREGLLIVQKSSGQVNKYKLLTSDNRGTSVSRGTSDIRATSDTRAPGTSSSHVTGVVTPEHPEVDLRSRVIEVDTSKDLPTFVQLVLKDTELKRRKITPETAKLTEWYERWIQDGHSEDQLLRAWAEASEWLTTSKKKYKNPISFLNNWVKRNKQSSSNGKYQAPDRSNEVASMHLPDL